MSVISKTVETTTVSSYFVTALAGPLMGKVRVAKGEELRMSEHQARALLASGALVDDKAKVDDPFGDVARAKAEQEAAEKAATEARLAGEAEVARKAREAEEAQAAADRAAADAAAAAGHVDGDHHDDLHSAA